MGNYETAIELYPACPDDRLDQMNNKNTKQNRILVIDDDLNMLQTIRDFLEARDSLDVDYKVRVYEFSAHAHQQVRSTGK